MTDTPPEVAKLVRELVMARSGAERMLMAAQSFEAAKTMILASFPPDLSEAERKRRLFQRIYGIPLPPEFNT